MHIFLILLTVLILLDLLIAKFSKKAGITARFFADVLNQQILSIDNEFGNGKISES